MGVQTQPGAWDFRNLDQRGSSVAVGALMPGFRVLPARSLTCRTQNASTQRSQRQRPPTRGVNLRFAALRFIAT